MILSSKQVEEVAELFATPQRAELFAFLMATVLARPERDKKGYYASAWRRYLDSFWLTVKEAARGLCGVSSKLVYAMFHEGKLLGHKIEGTIRIERASVEAYLVAHSNEKAQPVAAEPLTVNPKPINRRKRADRFRFFPSA
jgi:excisionase family DNA binding protein